MTADEIDIALYNIWRDPRFQVLNQVHDSILFQLPEAHAAEYIPDALQLARAPLTLKHDRPFCVPVEAKVGYNWADASEKNPNGLKKFK